MTQQGERIEGKPGKGAVEERRRGSSFKDD